MIKYWVIHNSKNLFYNCCQEETQESYLNVTGVQFLRLQIWTEISHSLGLQKSRDLAAWNGSLGMWQPEMWRTYLKCVSIV